MSGYAPIPNPDNDSWINSLNYDMEMRQRAKEAFGLRPVMEEMGIAFVIGTILSSLLNRRKRQQ